MASSSIVSQALKHSSIRSSRLPSRTTAGRFIATSSSPSTSIPSQQASTSEEASSSKSFFGVSRYTTNRFRPSRLQGPSRSLTIRRSYSSHARTVACPACEAAIELPSSEQQVVSHCPSCNAFLPPSDTTDYFHLFSLPPQHYIIDKSQLRFKFLQWQGLVHPDRLPQVKDSKARRQQEDWANMWSSMVNEGYKTLSDDRLRGEYMLGKKGVAIEEEDKMEDPELLMEIMEVRESLEDANTQEEVDTIREENRGECIFHSWDV
jgi:Fe-S protein assembly co-chaperone HscB